MYRLNCLLLQYLSLRYVDKSKTENGKREFFLGNSDKRRITDMFLLIEKYKSRFGCPVRACDTIVVVSFDMTFFPYVYTRHEFFVIRVHYRFRVATPPAESLSTRTIRFGRMRKPHPDCYKSLGCVQHF